MGHYYRRPGEEHGSSRWGTKADIKPFMNPDPEKNIILSQTEGLNIEEFVKNPKYSRNKNVCVIGGSGTGKTRFFVKPNLMQLHSTAVTESRCKFGNPSIVLSKVNIHLVIIDIVLVAHEEPPLNSLL